MLDNKVNHSTYSLGFLFTNRESNRLFYISNSDFQTVDTTEELIDLISKGFSVLELGYDNPSFYIKVPKVFQTIKKGKNI